ncbi:MAG: hypothetical protein ACREBR_00865 [bacterium]
MESTFAATSSSAAQSPSSNTQQKRQLRYDGIIATLIDVSKELEKETLATTDGEHGGFSEERQQHNVLQPLLQKLDNVSSPKETMDIIASNLFVSGDMDHRNVVEHEAPTSIV